MTDSAGLAKSELERVLALLEFDPENAGLLSRAATVAVQSRQLDEAGRLIERLVRREGETVLSLRLSAHVAMIRGRYAEAVPLLEAASRFGDDAALDADRSVALWGCGRFAECVDFVRQRMAGGCALVDLPPTMLSAYLRGLHALNELETARETVESLLGSGADQDDLRSIGALIVFDQGDIPTARKLLAGLRAPSAMCLEALVVSGYLAVGRGELEDAERFFEKALARNPGDGRSLLGMGLMKMADGGSLAAESWLRQAIESMPSHLGSRHALGWCRLCGGDRDDAKRIFAAALELDPTFAESHAAMAVIHALEGDRARADHHLERARRLDPSSATGRFAAMILSGDLRQEEIEKLARELAAGAR